MSSTTYQKSFFFLLVVLGKIGSSGRYFELMSRGTYVEGDYWADILDIRWPKHPLDVPNLKKILKIAI